MVKHFFILNRNTYITILNLHSIVLFLRANRCIFYELLGKFEV